MATADIKLKGLSREQVSSLLPEGLISLCWRGAKFVRTTCVSGWLFAILLACSVAHRTYAPKNDADSIDDKDIMGVYIGPLEHYLGFGRKEGNGFAKEAAATRRIRTGSGSDRVE